MKTIRPIYLDCHATTPLDPRVLAEMAPFFSENFGNASSIGHVYGERAARAVEEARRQVAELLFPHPNEDAAKGLVFTSGATESNNLALKGVMMAAAPGSHFLVTAAEHKSVLGPARSLARQGFELTVLPVDEGGCVAPSQVAAALRPSTVLASVIFANNEIGAVNDILKIGAECRSRGVLLHTDAVQAAGVWPIDLAEAPIDLLSLSAHKLYGPQGIGALYVRPAGNGAKVRLAPQIEGGGQERRLRSGTLPVALAVGFGAACRLCLEQRESDRVRIAALRDRLWRLLNERLDGLAMNGPASPRLPGNLSVQFPGVQSGALLASLRNVLAASSGAACSSEDPRPSHVLEAIGLSSEQIASSVRFGLGRFTTEEEIDVAAHAIAEAVERLRASR